MTKIRPPGSIYEALIADIDAAGGTKVVAGLIEKSRFTLQHETDPDDAQHRMWIGTLSRLAQVLGAMALPCVNLAMFFATAARGVFVPVQSGSDPDLRLGELTAAAIEDGAKANAEIMRSLADGEMDAREARRCLPLVGQHLRDQAELYGRVLARAEGRA